MGNQEREMRRAPSRGRRFGPVVRLLAPALAAVAAGVVVLLVRPDVHRLLVAVGLVAEGRHATPTPVCDDPPPSPPEPATWTPEAGIDGLTADFAADLLDARDSPVTITILYDLPPAFNHVHDDNGFAALIEGYGAAVMFDAGRRPDILAKNVATLGKSLDDIGVVIVSHTSDDHVRGIHAFKSVAKRPIIYAPSGSDPDQIRALEPYGAEVRLISRPTRLMPGIFTTGPPPAYPELGLVLATAQGAVHFVSCGHASRVTFMRHAARLAGGVLYLDLGGFCALWDAPLSRKRNAWARVKGEDPGFIGYLHCAQPDLRALAANDWPDRCLDIGAGAIIRIPTGPPAPPVVGGEKTDIHWKGEA